MLAHNNLFAVVGEAYFVAKEVVGTYARTRHAQQQSRIARAAALLVELNIDLDGATGNSLFAHKLGSAVSKRENVVALDDPFAVVHVEIVEQRVGGRFLEALAENLLVVKAAVNLVVNILDARAVEVGGDILLHLFGIDLYNHLLALCKH